jgi:hypothetical protein
VPLETVHNDIPKATHANMDEKVLATDDEPSTMASAAFLLITIVQESEGKLDPQYGGNSNARDLLQRHSDLFEMLKVAWRKKSFREIRELRKRSSFLLLDLSLFMLAQEYYNRRLSSYNPSTGLWPTR